MRRCYSPSAASVLVAVWASAHTAAGFAPSARPLQSSPFARTAARNGLEKLKMGRIGSRSGADEGFREVGDAVRTQRRDPWDNPLAQPQTSKFWLNPFPLAPYGTARPTVATRISNDIYSFEQEHGTTPSHPPILPPGSTPRRRDPLQMRHFNVVLSERSHVIFDALLWVGRRLGCATRRTVVQH